MHSDIVGDVTIELARMIERALPGQILLGEFESLRKRPDLLLDSEEKSLDSIRFVDHARENLAQLNGLELSGDAIESIKCYLTGRPNPDGTFGVRRLIIHDKHGLKRNAFNAKINIYRATGTPILLGIEDRNLQYDELAANRADRISRTPPAH